MMTEGALIQLVPQNQLNVELYDQIIASAANSRIYALSWYLDHVVDQWDVLIYGDYEYVMPIPWKSKWGIRYAIQPPFTQQLGIFPAPPAEVMEHFLQAVWAHFRLARLQLNSDNTAYLEGLAPRQNLLLNLHFPYEGLYAEYSRHTCRHLKRAADRQFAFSEGLMATDYIAFKQSVGTRAKLNTHPDVLQRLMGYLLYTGRGFLYGVYNRENQLCAAALFVQYGKRLIYLNGASLKNPGNEGAMYFLMDTVVQRFAGRPVYLDFEGSVLPGVARFFKGFGARREIYYTYFHNRLPIPLRWLL